MIEIPPLTQEILEDLGDELGGRKFTGEYQQAFLASGDTRDIQAVPGNGKTTLLVAKLALLSRDWTSRTQGVCVISHTNAAREEVEKKLSTHPSASAFLRYPHFIGTVTAFIDRFIALPYLRGLGWAVHRIDDDLFFVAATAKRRSKPTLTRTAFRNRHGVEKWVGHLELAGDFVCEPEVKPEKLKIKKKGNRQPGVHTDSGRELEELKAELTNEGLFRFADMTVLAEQAIEKCPALVDRIRRRFPLVLLDEAQDTNGAQLALLEHLFGNGVVYQRLGDQNQTLYEDDELTADDYWKAREGVIPLNHSWRFGESIASFASRLTVRAAQKIDGNEAIPCRRSLILFDRNTISGVLPAYADEVRAHWGAELTTDHDIRAVASRHNPTRDTRGDWPKTLVDYCPDYRSGGGRYSRPDKLCTTLRQAALLHLRHSPPVEVADHLTIGILSLLRMQGVQDAHGQLVTKRNVWSWLAETDRDLPLALRRLMRDQILVGEAAWVAALWAAFRDELKGLLDVNHGITAEAEAFLEFVEEGSVTPNQQTEHGGRESRIKFIYDGIPVRLGSIHSVKGKTVDSILIVESEVWRRSSRTMDLATVLPHAFGIENKDFDANPAHLAAATNIFVGATRPQELLAFALRKEAATAELIEAAHEQGWNICDLTQVPVAEQVGNDQE